MDIRIACSLLMSSNALIKLPSACEMFEPHRGACLFKWNSGHFK